MKHVLLRDLLVRWMNVGQEVNERHKQAAEIPNGAPTLTALNFKFNGI